MKYIILDTNIFVQDFWMKGNSFSLFMSSYNLVANKIAVPQVIYDEVLSQYDKKINEQLEKLTTPINKITKLTNNNIDISPIVKKLSCTKPYIKFFNNFIKNNVLVLDYPKIPHKDIAIKSMKRQKPFKNNGEGYCDSLIWENILTLLKKKNCEEIYFITNNSKDFYNNGQLAYDLQNELKNNNIDANKFHIYTELKDFSDEKILPLTKQLTDLTKKININSFDNFNINNWLEDSLYDYIDPIKAAVSLLNLKTSDCTVYLSEVYHIDNVQVLDARLIDSSTKYITLKANCGLGINICASSDQYKNSKELQYIFDQDQGMYSDYGCINNSGIVQITFTLMIKNDDIENSNIEVLSLDGI